MDINERIKMVESMKFIALQLKDVLIFDEWLLITSFDGKGSFGSTVYDDITLESRLKDDAIFADLMDSFLLVMSTAYNDKSGLYCDGIVSKPEGEQEENDKH